MAKPRFGELLRTAREKNGLSLRGLAEHVGMDYSRLARIEGGDRPPPGLSDVRQLAEALGLDMVDLLVSAGTPREVVEHLLWSERVQEGGTDPDAAYRLGRTPLLTKNTFRVPVLRRNQAECTVQVGQETLQVFSFSRGAELLITVPPEAVVVSRHRPESSTAENVLAVRIRKLRRLGQVINLVLAGSGFEINSLHGSRALETTALAEGDDGFAAVQSTAIRTRGVDAADKEDE